MLSRNNDCFDWADLISSGIKLFCIPVNKVIRATACEQAPYLGDIVKSPAQARAATERRRKSGGREKERRAYNDLCDEFSFPAWKPQSVKTVTGNKKSVSVSYTDSLRTNYYTIAQRQDFFLRP